MLARVAMPAVRQKRSKLAPTSCQASSMVATGTTAADVVGSFMALLSFVDSAPRAYRLKVGNACPPISTSTGTSPELAAAEITDLHLPMPTDARLRRMVDLMLAAPADRSLMEVWARRVGLSERTLARLISRETGMNFGRWRQQLSVLLAVKWLAGGGSIQQVAADLGYESMPSFVTMFKKTLGTSPGRYMAERHVGRL